MRVTRSQAAVIVATGLALAASGCTLPGGAKAARSASASAAAGTASAIATPSASPTTEVSASASPSLGGAVSPSASPSPTASASASTTASATPSPTPTAVTVKTVPGRPTSLELALASSAQGWSQGAGTPTGAGASVESLMVPVSCQAAPAPLRYTMAAPTTGTLTLHVAQDVTSPSASEHLAWAVTVDGRPVPATSIGFKDGADITVPLTAAGTISIAVTDTGACLGPATGLITSATVTA